MVQFRVPASLHPGSDPWTRRKLPRYARKTIKNNSSTAFFVNPDAKSFLSDCPVAAVSFLAFFP
jgi:hypothetical protein